MLGKITKIAALTAAGIIAGIIVLYLFTGFVIVPLALPKIVSSQGTKYLGHTVSLGGASFNPITLRLALRDLSVLDSDNTEMAGFGKFWLDVEARRLVKKQYRISTVGFDGLRVNAVLLPGNRINLMSLMPERGEQPPSKPGPMPGLAVGEIVLRNGTLTFSDQCVGKGFVMRANDVTLDVTGLSTKPGSRVKMALKANIDGKGLLSTEALVEPFARTPHIEASFSLDGYAMRALTPYVGKYTGRAVKDGSRLDLRLAYRIVGNKIEAGHKLMVQDFSFAEKVESKDALPLPFGLAVALLKDPRGLIDVSLPVQGDVTDPKFSYWHILGQVAANFFKKIALSPFKALHLLVPGGGETKEMASVSFAPGGSSLSDGEKAKLARLAAAMNQRPGLSFAINGGYDPEIDWNAIRADVFEKEFAKGIKDPAAPVYPLYEEAYRSRFGKEECETLKSRFTKDGGVDEAALAAEMKRVLIEKSEPGKDALKELARARIQAAREAFIAAGLDDKRVRDGAARQSVAVMNRVPVELVLTVPE